MRSDQTEIQQIFDDRTQQNTLNFKRNRILKQIHHTKLITATEKIIMMLVLVSLAFTVFSAATMYFMNCWVISSIPFYFGSLQFVLTFSVFIYNIKISKIQLWAYKMIGVMNVLTAIINLIMYFVQFQQNILCSNAICHANFTGAYIIENMISEGQTCSRYDNLNSLQKSYAIFQYAEESLKKICPNTTTNEISIETDNIQNQCQPQLSELYVFNQTGYFIGLMIVTSIYFIHGGMHLYKAIKIDKLKGNKENYEDFSCQIMDGEAQYSSN